MPQPAQRARSTPAAAAGRKPTEDEACDVMARSLYALLGSLDAVLPVSLLAERGTTLVEAFDLELDAAERDGRSAAEQRREMQRMLAQIKDAFGEQRKGAPMSASPAGERLARRLHDRVRDAVRFRFLDAGPATAGPARERAAFLRRFGRPSRPASGTPVPLDASPSVPPAASPPPPPPPAAADPAGPPGAAAGAPPEGEGGAGRLAGLGAVALDLAAVELPLVPPLAAATSELVHLVLPQGEFAAGEEADGAGGGPELAERRASFPALLLAPIEMPGPKNVDIIYRGAGGHGRPAAGGLASRSFEILHAGVPESVRHHRLSSIAEDASTPDGGPPSPSGRRSAPAAAFRRAASAPLSGSDEAGGEEGEAAGPGAPGARSPLSAFVDAVLAAAARQQAGGAATPSPTPSLLAAVEGLSEAILDEARALLAAPGPPRRPASAPAAAPRPGTAEEVAAALAGAVRAAVEALEAEEAAGLRRAASPLVEEALREAAARAVAAWLAPLGLDLAALEAFVERTLAAVAAGDDGPASPEPPGA